MTVQAFGTFRDFDGASIDLAGLTPLSSIDLPGITAPPGFVIVTATVVIRPDVDATGVTLGASCGESFVQDLGQYGWDADAFTPDVSMPFTATWLSAVTEVGGFRVDLVARTAGSTGPAILQRASMSVIIAG